MTPTQTAPSRISRAEFDKLFEELSNWGLWGADDERGTLNYIQPEHLCAAAALVRTGRSVSLALPINTVAGPDNTRPAVHYMVKLHDIDSDRGKPRFAGDTGQRNSRQLPDPHRRAVSYRIQRPALQRQTCVLFNVPRPVTPGCRRLRSRHRREGRPARHSTPARREVDRARRRRILWRTIGRRGRARRAAGHRRHPALPDRSSPSSTGDGAMGQQLRGPRKSRPVPRCPAFAARAAGSCVSTRRRRGDRAQRRRWRSPSDSCPPDSGHGDGLRRQPSVRGFGGGL